MIKLTLSEVIEALAGRSGGDAPPMSVGAVSTDSRTIAPGDLFFALLGERFDGHRFVVDALRGGALGAVVAVDRASDVTSAIRTARPPLPNSRALIEVDNTIAALGRLAQYHRLLLAADVIAVVGSNGKTTTKAMIDHILSLRLRGRCSPKSYNNAVGVPLTLLSPRAGDEYLVVEIGTNAPGEIAALAAIAQPDMAVLTCVSEEHLEKLGDVEGVAAEECSIFNALRSGGFAAVNSDAPQVRTRLGDVRATIATFGRHADADLRLSEVRYESPWLNFTLNGRFRYRLRLPGVHNAVNAAGAITIARRLGFEHEEITARLESFVAPPMRTELVRIGGVTVINDAYNSNPGSALAAFDALESYPTRGRRIVVFGEMRELGTRSADQHRRVAERLAAGRVDRVILVGAAGELMHAALTQGTLFAPSLEHCADVESCVEHLAEDLSDGDVVLLKASRAVGLERLLEPLRQRLAATSAV